jgi:CheY-like chemotaxis protein
MSEETGPVAAGQHELARVILIVEDDEAIGTFLVQAIQQETLYYPHWVADGLTALQLLHHLTPDLLILDYQLPHLNGMEVYDQVRTMQGCEDIPVIFMTASTGMPWRRLEKRKIVGLGKPLELSTFLQTVEELLTATS